MKFCRITEDDLIGVSSLDRIVFHKIYFHSTCCRADLLDPIVKNIFIQRWRIIASRIGIGRYDGAVDVWHQVACRIELDSTGTPHWRQPLDTTFCGINFAMIVRNNCVEIGLSILYGRINVDVPQPGIVPQVKFYAFDIDGMKPLIFVYFIELSQNPCLLEWEIKKFFAISIGNF